MILQTQRLLIEEAQAEDAPFFYQLMNNPTWLEFIGDRNIKDLEKARDYIQNTLIKSYQSLGYGLYKCSLKQEHLPIGICGFVKRDFLPQPDIGFAILPEFASRGFIFEAAQATLKYGKESLGLSPILAITSPQNQRSQRLLLRLGFKLADTSILPPEEKNLLLFIQQDPT